MAHDLDTAADLDEVLRHAMSPEIRTVLTDSRLP